MPDPTYASVPNAAQLRGYSKEPRELAALLATLATLDAGRATSAAYLKAGEWIAANVPHDEVTERNRMRVPAWAISAWLDELWLDANEEGGATCDNWDAEWWFWRHRWGVVRVYGVTALTTEPYYVTDALNGQLDPAEVAAAPKLLRELGRRLDGVAAWSPRAVWPGPGASRIWFFPHPTLFPRVLSRRLQRSFYRPDILLKAPEIIAQARGVPYERWAKRVSHARPTVPLVVV